MRKRGVEWKVTSLKIAGAYGTFMYEDLKRYSLGEWEIGE